MARVFDDLIIGSGIGALSYALTASDQGRDVLIVTKRALNEANTRYAQGGIAAVMRSEDSFDDHVQDTLRAGAGLCRREVVDLVVSEGPRAIERLVELGIRFDKTGDVTAAQADAEESGAYDLTREGGHSHRRVLHSGDITGAEIMRGLEAAVRSRSNITVLEEHCAVDLLTTRKVEGLRTGPAHRPPADENRCLGAYVLDETTGQVKTFLAKVTLLATGGAGKVYLYTSNPDVATGDGIAMAYRVGAEVANLEFIQFHPTCLFHPKAKSFLISEALRGEGGILRRMDGTRFMEAYHPMKELAPRDIVARAIDTELKRTGDDHVQLDMTHEDPDFLAKRFPSIHETCMSFGVDMRTQPIPVVPAAHYVCGGVRTDLDGESTIPGLYVAGEAACTGLHGANRLASNSLLEATVFGFRAAHASRKYIEQPAPDASAVPDWDTGNAVPSDERVVITQNWDEIRRFMWNYVGIVRTNRRLQRAQRRIETIREEVREFYWYATVTRDLLELRNITTVAELIVNCALKRRESRGLHYNADYPDLNKNDAPSDTILVRRALV
ncbi:MAG: L-aspartate oxidase [Deltaproteobacteria bacterium]|nr:L-aspartate oxidase [Deltaproteobacteria bacterium]